jgi:hypothetical protein
MELQDQLLVDILQVVEVVEQSQHQDHLMQVEQEGEALEVVTQVLVLQVL